MKTRQLGNSDLKVSVFGLGCMGMSEFYGATDEAEAVATLHRALDRGVTLLDTAAMYGFGHNETEPKEPSGCEAPAGGYTRRSI